MKETKYSMTKKQQERAERLLSVEATLMDSFNTQEVKDDARMDPQNISNYIRPVSGVPVYDDNEKYW